MWHIAGLAQVHKDIGLRQERMTLILLNVMADQAHTDLKFFVANNSCIDYDIKEVNSCSQSGAKKSIAVTPVLTTQQRWIAAYDRTLAAYASSRQLH